MSSMALASTSSTQTMPAQRAWRKIVLPGQTPEGEHILALLHKRTYSIGPDGMCARAAEDFKIVPADTHYQDPMNSSVQYESDFVPFKPATDVVFNGNVYAPQSRPVDVLLASLQIGPHLKTIRVTGDRLCHHQASALPVFGDPEPFVCLPVRYERAYGGVDIYSDPMMPCIYPRNHLGKGFVIGRDKKQIEGLALPNFEDPEDPLTPERLCVGKPLNWEQQPMPQGLGWFAKFWRPRADLAGVMPADRGLERALREAYSRAVPENQREAYAKTHLPDMDFRFFNGASEGLSLPCLNGDEIIRLTHLTPEEQTTIHLPGDRPRLGLDIGTGVQTPPAVLYTVQLRMEDHAVDLLWRAAVPYPGPDWLPEMKKLEVLIE